MTAKQVVAVDRFIGARIRRRRQELGLSQTELAKELGVTFQQVQKYESGFNRVCAARLFEIARVLCVPILAFYPEAEIPAEDPVLRDRQRLSDVMDSTDGQRLCRALMRVRDVRTRRKLIALVEEIAGADTPPLSD